MLIAVSANAYLVNCINKWEVLIWPYLKSHIGCVDSLTRNIRGFGSPFFSLYILFFFIFFVCLCASVFTVAA